MVAYILVARRLEGFGINVEHILEDGSIESHEMALDRLLRQLHLSGPDLFHSREDMIEEAYRIQGERIAYDTGDGSSGGAKPIGSIPT